MGYIKHATIKNQIETNMHLVLIHRHAEHARDYLNAIADEINNYVNTSKLNVLDIYPYITLLNTSMEHICELAKEAELDIEIHE